MAVRKVVSKVMMTVLSGAALVASGVIFTSNSEDVVRDGFAVALKDVPAAEKIVAREDHASKAPVAGSEEYWLTAARPEMAHLIKRTISIGDTIALRFGDNKRRLIVSSVSEVAPKVTAIDTRTGPSRLFLVTAKEAADESAPPIQFLMELGTPVAEEKPASGRVL